MSAARSPDRAVVLSPQGLGALLDELRQERHRLIGPTVRDGAIVHDDIAGLADLPRGWTEEQSAGSYRLRRREDEALFGYSTGPQSFKRLFFLPRLRLWSARREGDGGFTVEPEHPEPSRLALIGARACDLHALAVQDRIFLQGPQVDPDYAARRREVFVVAIHCGQAGGTCFCASMGTGPRAAQGFDLALTELLDPEHRLLVEAGTERGAALLSRVDHRPATGDDLEAAAHAVERAARSMGRALDTGGIKELLHRNLEHPRWDDVARRCLSCANCTLVCPTCFCHAVEDVTNLTGDHTARWRRWDSCFSMEHSYLHGGSVRGSTRARYRQWVTHKLASWIDQFGTSGCTGCGRCITWCPVRIDLTEEVAAIRATRSDTPPDA